MPIENPPDELNYEYYQDTVFSKQNFKGRVLREKEFCKCKFIKSDFYKTNLQSCIFEDCLFENCDLSLWIINGSRFTDVTFKESKIIGVQWNSAKPPIKANFYDCILNNSVFAGLNLNSIEIIKCQVWESDFSDANLTKAKICSSDLRNSTFHKTTLVQADFSDSTNYSINPNLNKLKKTIFNLPEAIALLKYFDIIVK